METKLYYRQLEAIRTKCNLPSYFGVDHTSLSGGLALCRKQNIEVTINSFSKGHIDSVILHPSKGPLHLIGFYGNPNTMLRHFSWQLLEQLKTMFDLPWFFVGDFNEILLSMDKRGG